ncbi:H-NS family nucleoid-associated regulatory protein [Stenotrophomonas maltophilia]|uniref:H-NS histone family protein n=1 Tax=Stenotrophomonas maltophilia TaxID=40324 RepID=UPI00209B5252|nr:H-NS histone family protein [Stenotrophomonas maltophilia]MCO7486958.1 H-NS histone family protein [Stenotrophomonas maltophilia]
MNLDKLSPAELQALIHTAEAKMESARKNQIQEVRSKIDSILKNAGLTIGEVYPQRGRAGKSPKATVAPKYRNPADASQTWSGRGKRPAWFVEALKKRGVTPESLLIDGAAPKTAPAKKATRKSAREAGSRKAAKA